jgi:hypothetical protein
LLNKINNFDYPEVNIKNNPGKLVILNFILSKLLDHERPAVNLGSYTARDLDYLLPLCNIISKSIECVESFTEVADDIRGKLISEIESNYTSPLITWTWDDAHNSKYLRSADYVFISTDYRFPVEDYILSTNHPCVWSTTTPSWIWVRLGQALYNQQLHLIIDCNGLFFFTNSLELKQQFEQNIPYLDQMLKKHNAYIDYSGELYKLRNNKPGSGMNPQWEFINRQ